jgi:hypothetical protein
LVLVVSGWASTAQGGQLSHYSAMPGLAFMDDYFIPAPEMGRLFFAQYSTWYGTDTFRNADGNEVDRITVTRPGGQERDIDLDLDVDSWLLGPVLLWSPGWRVLGARYGAFVMVPVSNPTVAANLETEVGLGLGIETSSWGLSDLYAQPLWLEWNVDRLDITAAYGFFAPTGRYEGGATDNTGFGFWGHQLQSALRYRVNETVAASVALTGEINQNKEDADIVPGSHLTLNWGARKHFFDDWFQFGFAGYDTWQVSDDDGADVTVTTRDQVHGVGFQTGVPRLGLAVKYMYEFNAQDRFEGQTVSIFYAVPLEPALKWIGLS